MIPDSATFMQFSAINPALQAEAQGILKLRWKILVSVA